jgi:hypothetical protein
MAEGRGLMAMADGPTINHSHQPSAISHGERQFVVRVGQTVPWFGLVTGASPL